MSNKRAPLPPALPLTIPSAVRGRSVMDKMLILAPVHLYLKGGYYNCDWTLNVPHWWIARGTGHSWAAAAYEAWKEAFRKGWVVE